MTSLIRYIPNASVYKNIEESTKGRRRFYTAQIGKGDSSSVKLVTPTQQAVERAKEDLKREKKEINKPSPGGINYISKRPSKTKRVRKGSGEKKQKSGTSPSPKKKKHSKNIHKKYKKK